MGREQRQFIQFIAALTMLIDHIGMVFFPSAIGFRAIGRLSFPLFAFGIAEGVRYTHCFWWYFGRILLTAVLSQPIYMLLFGITQGNPLFMLAWGAAALYFFRQRKKAVAAAWIQLLSLFSFGFLDGKWRVAAFSKKLPRYFFYVFYPLHLLVLWGIKAGIS